MPDARLRKFLKLFCIEELGQVPIGPSRLSWLVFCLLLLGSILLAASGVYFHLKQMSLSAIICFPISAAGFVMTLVALSAILLGYNRRRRCRVSNTNGGEDINEAIPARSDESVWVDIEKDLVETSHNAESNQQWIDPTLNANFENPLYETELKPLVSELETELKPLVSDFEETDSDYFDSSSETRTSVHNSSLEGYDSYRTTSKESYLNAVGEDCLGNYEDCGWVVEQKLENGRVVALKIVSTRTASGRNLNDSISHQESKLDQFQVYSHHKMTTLQMMQSSSRNFQDEVGFNGNPPLVESKNDFYGGIDNPGCYFHSNSVEHNGMDPNHIEGGGNMPMYPTGVQNGYINLAFQTFQQPTVVNQTHESHANVEHQGGLRYPNVKLFNATEHAGRKQWKWSERNEDMVPRIKKRPLLDVNGDPISQYEYGKVLAKLLKNGLQQFPTHPMETCF